MAQTSSFGVRDASTLDAATDDAASRPAHLEAVEYGSGWYHDAAIGAPEPAPAQKH